MSAETDQLVEAIENLVLDVVSDWWGQTPERRVARRKALAEALAQRIDGSADA